MGDIQGWNLPMASKQRQVYGNGFILVGDAAGLVDPLTGEGIGNAMRSGKVAADFLAGVCKGLDYSATHLKKYPVKVVGNIGVSSLILKHHKVKFTGTDFIKRTTKNRSDVFTYRYIINSPVWLKKTQHSRA